MHKVILLENDEFVSRWLSQLISGIPTLELVGTAACVADGIKLLDLCPDFALVDLMLDDGPAYEFIEKAKTNSATRVLIVSVLSDEESVLSAVQAGADGYVKKEASEVDLVAAIGAVMRGEAPMSPTVARHVLRTLQNNHQPNTAECADLLSPRELQVLESLAFGLNYKEVAKRYDLSHHTVAKYIKTIYRKLSVNSRAEAVVEGMRNGLISMPKK